MMNKKEIGVLTDVVIAETVVENNRIADCLEVGQVWNSNEKKKRLIININKKEGNNVNGKRGYIIQYIYYTNSIEFYTSKTSAMEFAEYVMDKESDNNTLIEVFDKLK